MENEEIFIYLVADVIAYLAMPIFCHFKNIELTKERLKKIMWINTIVAWIIMQVLQTAIFGYYEQVAPSLLFVWIGYKIMKKNLVISVVNTEEQKELNEEVFEETKEREKDIYKDENMKICENDVMAKKVFELTGLKEKMLFKDYTNAKFINEHFNAGYGQWGRSRWELSQDKNKGPQADNMIVWLVCIDSEEREGWINYDFGEEIIEDMSNGIKMYKIGRKEVSVREYAMQYPYRIVVQKIKSGNKNDFRVRGLYKFDEKRSVDDNQHYYVKI